MIGITVIAPRRKGYLLCLLQVHHREDRWDIPIYSATTLQTAMTTSSARHSPRCQETGRMGEETAGSLMQAA